MDEYPEIQPLTTQCDLGQYPQKIRRKKILKIEKKNVKFR